MTDEDVEQWLRTGRLRCADCGARVRCENLTSLPPHQCAERQARREQNANA